VGAAGTAVNAVGGGGGTADPSMDSAGLAPGASAPGADPSMDSAGLAPGGGWDQLADLARRAGQSVADYVRANPGIVNGLIGAGAGFLANKDPFTSTVTETSTIDPAIAAQRDYVTGQVNHWAANPSVYSPSGGGGIPAPASFGTGGPTLFAGGSAGSAAGYSGMPGGQQMAPNGMPLSATNQGPMLRTQGAPAGQGASSGMPDWGGSGAYMPEVQRLLGQGTQSLTATQNPYASETNPYLQALTAAGTRDMSDAYARTVAPKFASGSSFGSSGLAFAELAERDNLMKRQGDLVNNLLFQDYNLRSELTEKGAKRQDDLSNAQRSNFLTAGNTFGNLAQGAGEFNANFDFDKWKIQQDGVKQRIDALLETTNRTGNTTRTSTTVNAGNPWLGAAGGWMAGSNWGAPTPKPAGTR